MADTVGNYGPHEAILKIFPSTEAPDARSSITNQHSIITPQQMKNIVEEFKTPNCHFKPLYFMWEHGVRKNDCIGEIKDVWYDEKHKWLMGRATGLSKNLKAVIDRGMLTDVSLKFGVTGNNDIIRPLEVSATKKGDMPNAEFITCFSEDNNNSIEFKWNLKEYGLKPFLYKRNNEVSQTRFNKVNNSPTYFPGKKYSTMNAEHEPAAQEAGQPVDQSMAISEQDLETLKKVNSMSDEKRMQALTKLYANARRSQEEYNALSEEAKFMKQEAEKLREQQKKAEEDRITKEVQKNFNVCKRVIMQDPGAQNKTKEEIQKEAVAMAHNYVVNDPGTLQKFKLLLKKSSSKQNNVVSSTQESVMGKRSRNNYVDFKTGNNTVMRFPSTYMNEQGTPKYQYVQAHSVNDGKRESKRLCTADDIFRGMLENADLTHKPKPAAKSCAEESRTPRYQDPSTLMEEAIASYNAATSAPNTESDILIPNFEGSVRAHSALTRVLSTKQDKTRNAQDMENDMNQAILEFASQRGDFKRNFMKQNLLVSSPKDFWKMVKMGRHMQPRTNGDEGLWGIDDMKAGKQSKLRPSVLKYMSIQRS